MADNRSAVQTPLAIPILATQMGRPRLLPLRLPSSKIRWFALLALLVSVGASPGTLFAAQPCQVVLTGQSRIPLSLDWKFAMGGHAEGRDPAFDDSLWPAAAPPFRPAGLPGGRTGEFWMRCHIVLAGARPDPFFLHLERATDAMEVYFNGTLIGRRGTVAPFSLSSPEAADVPIPPGLWQEQNVLSLRLFAASPLSTIAPAPELTRFEGTARWDRLDVLALALSALIAIAATLWLLRGLLTRTRRDALLVSLFGLTFAAAEAIRHGMRTEWFDSYAGSAVARAMLGITIPVLLLEWLLHRSAARRTRPMILIEMGAAVIALLVGVILFLPPHFQAAVLALGPYLYAAFLAGFWAFNLHQLSRLGGMVALRPLLPALLPLALATFLDLAGSAGLLPLPGIVIFVLPVLPAAVVIAWRSESVSSLEPAPETATPTGLRPTADAILATVRADFARRVAAAREFPRAKSARSNNSSSTPAEPSDPLERWIQDVQILSDLQHDALERRPTRFSIREHIEGVAAEALSATEEKPNRLQMFLPPSQERFWSDARLIRSIVFHLVENALLYSSGKIEVRAERSGNVMRLRVRDQGPGMPSDLRDHVFDPFVRGSRKPGSGLGLTFVDRAVAHLGGRLHMESGEGFFTLVEIDIPELQEGAA